MKKIYGIRNCAICDTPYKSSHARTATCSRPCGYEMLSRRRIADAEKSLGEPLKEGIERRMAEGMTVTDIARACGMKEPRNFYPIMERLGIPRRSRSESVKLQWKDNETRRAAIGSTFSEWAKSHPAEAMANSIKANLILQNTSPTSIERRLMDALHGCNIPYEFQYVVGDKFLCDFAFPQGMLIVECDGEYWHSTPKQRARDASKDAYLQACGYTVLRLSDKRIEQDADSCVHAIMKLLGYID